jgi:hypothetical protein
MFSEAQAICSLSNSAQPSWTAMQYSTPRNSTSRQNSPNLLHLEDIRASPNLLELKDTPKYTQFWKMNHWTQEITLKHNTFFGEEIGNERYGTGTGVSPITIF